MARRKLKQTKAAKASRRRYRAKKRGGGGRVGAGGRMGAGVKGRKGRRKGGFLQMFLGPLAKMMGM